VVVGGGLVRMVVRLQKSNSSSTRAVRDKGGREGPPRQVASFVSGRHAEVAVALPWVGRNTFYFAGKVVLCRM
jgi:hypothetical protein